MTTWDDDRKAKWEASLLRWEKMYEEMVAMERGAFDLGVFSLKAALILNGGAVVAMLTFLAQILDPGLQSLRVASVEAMKLFFWGLASAGAAIAVAYLYQNFLLGKHWREMQDLGKDEGRLKWVLPLVKPAIWLAIALGLLSFGFFIGGGWSLFVPMTAFSPPVKI